MTTKQVDEFTKAVHKRCVKAYLAYHKKYKEPCPGDPTTQHSRWVDDDRTVYELRWKEGRGEGPYARYLVQGNEDKFTVRMLCIIITDGGLFTGFRNIGVEGWAFRRWQNQFPVLRKMRDNRKAVLAAEANTSR